ncbi:glycosyltransferase family 39 protein [Candidatus Micrarchaeota archaeon]|nr:glycosyltransferase family 39 protein [Candidatus Micrarchaeota archaeon]
MNWLRFWPMVLAWVIIAVLSLYFPVFAMDEYTYMNGADAFASNDLSRTIEIARFPAFPYLLSWFAFLGDMALAGKLLNLLFGGLAVFLTYRLGRELFNEHVGFWGAVLLATNPFFAFLEARVLTETLFVLLFVASLYALHRSLSQPKYLMGFGALAALLALTRFIGLYIFLIAFLYYWKNHRLHVIFSPHGIGAALAFLLFFSPYLVFSQTVTGNAFQFLNDFFFAQLNVRQGALSLPDQIPSYFLLFAFTLAFAFPLFLTSLVQNVRKFHRNAFALLGLAVFGVVFTMEIWGFFNFRLFRYLVPLIPFACLLSATYLAKKSRIEQWAAVAVFLNLLLSMALIAGAATQYDKHIAYVEAGRFAQSQCPGSIFSNIPAVLIHFLQRPIAYSIESGSISEACVIRSAYDGWRFDEHFDESAYEKVYDARGIQGFRRV